MLQPALLRIDAWFRRRSWLSTWLAGVLSLVAVGVLDYVTGVEVVVIFLYLVPVFIVTWRLGQKAGTIAALCCAVVCVGLDWFGRPGISALLVLWNLIGDFGIFAIVAMALSRIHDDLLEQKRLNAELQDALTKVKTLSGLLPICAWCNKIRDKGGEWHRLEEYLSAHAEVDFTHSICPECKQKYHSR